MKSALFIAFFLRFSVVLSSGEELRLLYIAQAGYQPRDIQTRTEEYTRESIKDVKLTFAEYEDVYDLVIKAAAGATAEFDVVLADLIWMDDYLARGILSPVPDVLGVQISQGIVPEIYRPFEKDGRFWAFPFLANHELFYVNMEMLKKAGFDKPPATLEEMEAMAGSAKKAGLIKYPIFDSLGKREALICEFTTLTGAFGGNLVDAGGKPRADSGPCRAALRFMVSLLDEGLMNPYALQSDEVFAAEAFLMGDVLFQTNWTFVTGRMQDKIYVGANKLAAALIPVARAVKPYAATSTVSGYQGLAVMANSKHKTDAWSFVQYLAAPEFQRQHLSEMSVWKEVWNEKRTLAIDPNIELKKAQLAGVHDRPGNPQYRSISLILQDALYDALTKKLPPDNALKAAQARIEALP